MVESGMPAYQAEYNISVMSNRPYSICWDRISEIRTTLGAASRVARTKPRNMNNVFFDTSAKPDS